MITIAMTAGTRRRNTKRAALLFLLTYFLVLPSLEEGETLTRISKISTDTNNKVESAYISGLIPFRTSL